jgi:hypothetical protein
VNTVGWIARIPTFIPTGAESAQIAAETNFAFVEMMSEDAKFALGF